MDIGRAVGVMSCVGVEREGLRLTWNMNGAAGWLRLLRLREYMQGKGLRVDCEIGVGIMGYMDVEGKGTEKGLKDELRDS